MGSRMDVMLEGMKTLVLLHISIRALRWPGVLWMNINILEKKIYSFFPEHWISTVGLKYSVNHHVGNRCAVMQGFLFHLYSADRADLPQFVRAIGVAGWLASTGFNWEPPAALAPQKPLSLSFQVLKPAIDCSSLAMTVLDGIFFQRKAVLSSLNINCLFTYLR